MRGHVAGARALVLAATKQWVQAHVSYEEASTSFAAYRLPWDRAATARAWADVLQKAGLHEEGAHARAVAEGTYARLEATGRWMSATRRS